MRTVDISRSDNGAVIIVVNDGEANTLMNPTNIRIKPMEDGTIIIKKSDETWRQTLYPDDEITINGTAAPTVIADLITVLSNNIFAGEQAWTEPDKIDQVITFGVLASRAHGAPAFLAGATASSGLSVTYASSDPTKATVNPSTGLITPVAAGSTDITASQAGNDFYAPATPIVQPLVLT